MVLAGGALFLAELVLLVYCVANIITTPEDQVRNLPKLVWLLLVVVLPLAGGIAWLVGGRPLPAQRPGGLPSGRAASLPWAGRQVRPAAVSPDDDEAFLRGLRERAEAQRREAQRREAQRQAAQEQESEREEQRPSADERPEEPGR